MLIFLDHPISGHQRQHYGDISTKVIILGIWPLVNCRFGVHISDKTKENGTPTVLDELELGGSQVPFAYCWAQPGQFYFFHPPSCASGRDGKLHCKKPRTRAGTRADKC